MDDIDKTIINQLQRGFPISEQPYQDVANKLAITEGELLSRLQNLLDTGILTRFGPLYDAERFGGALTLAAMGVPEQRFAEVSAIVNSFTEVAHNYRREHVLNMWFVLATETPEQLNSALTAIAEQTGLPVYNMPKIKEYFVGLYLSV